MGYMDEQLSRMLGSGQGQGGPWLRDQGSRFFGDARARRSGACNARWGYLESPVIIYVRLQCSYDTYPTSKNQHIFMQRKM
jgi:hypothetical protein